MRTIQAVRKATVRHQPLRKEQPKPEKNLKIVEGRRSKALSLPRVSFPVFILIVSLLTAGVLVNIAQKALVSQLSYDIESLKKEIQTAQQEQDKLLALKARLQSPQRIESVAIGKLSMVSAPKISYLKISEDGSKVEVVTDSKVSLAGVSGKRSSGTSGTGELVRTKASTAVYSQNHTIAQ